MPRKQLSSPTTTPPVLAATLDLPEFDSITVASLRESGSMKWTKYPESLAAFVAEMDFGVPAPITQAVNELMNRGVTGYMPRWIEDDLKNATAAWHARRYGWDLDPSHVFPVADVIQAYQFALEHFSRPNSKVILLTPAYGPFFLIPRLQGREVTEVPMIRTTTGWDIDDDRLRDAFREGGGLLVLCNPHNPIGAVYSRDQLIRVSQIVDEFAGRVFADEVHAPLVYPGNEHIPYASVNETAAAHTITATSASKAFNIPGLKCAQLITSNAADRSALEEMGVLITHGTSNVGAVANTAAYTACDGWFGGVLQHLEGSRKTMLDSLATHIPEAICLPPQATYFAWIDLTALPVPELLQPFFLKDAGVAISDGATFGDACARHVRFNFAMPRESIPVAVRAMAGALARLKA